MALGWPWRCSTHRRTDISYVNPPFFWAQYRVLVYAIISTSMCLRVSVWLIVWLFLWTQMIFFSTNEWFSFFTYEPRGGGRVGMRCWDAAGLGTAPFDLGYSTLWVRTLLIFQFCFSILCYCGKTKKAAVYGDISSFKWFSQCDRVTVRGKREKLAEEKRKNILRNCSTK
jgi:hypothetical protein